MSFSERMEQIRTPEELEALMRQVRRRGSSNWTLKTVRERVSEDLWPDLDAHFDEDGVILARSSEEDSASEDRPGRVSLVHLIRFLNADLLSARTRAIEEHRELVLKDRREAEARAQKDADLEVVADERPVEEQSPEAEDSAEVEATPALASSEALDVCAAPADPPEVPQRPKPKRRLVRRPEKVGGPPVNAKERPEPARPPALRQPEGVEETRPAGALVEAYQTHRFVDGWCSRCGTSSEAVLQWGDRCEAAPPN